MRTAANAGRQSSAQRARSSHAPAVSRVFPPGVMPVDVAGGSEELIALEKKVPHFLLKMWRIVNDATLSAIVAWDQSGYSFHIHDPYAFCKHVLPQFFKHNNLNSLVRQLNMYGFRKITPLERTGLSRPDSDREHVEFQHACFIRGRPDLLPEIKRKTTGGGSAQHHAKIEASDETASEPNQSRALDSVLEEVRLLREKQEAMDGRLSVTLQENNNLWREVSHLRQLHVKQQQVVSKLIQFLVRLLQHTRQRPLQSGRSFLAIAQGDDALVDVEGDGDAAPGPSSRKRPRYTDTMLVESALNALEKQLDTDKAIKRHSKQSGMVITDVTDDPDAINVVGQLGAQQQQQPFVDFTPDANVPPPVQQWWPLDAAASTSAQGGQQLAVSLPFSQLNPQAPDLHMLAESANAGTPLAVATPSTTNAVVSSNTPMLTTVSRPALEHATSVDNFRSELGDFLNGVDSSLDLFRDTLTECDMDSDTMRQLFDMCEEAEAERIAGDSALSTLVTSSSSSAPTGAAPLPPSQLAPNGGPLAHSDDHLLIGPVDGELKTPLTRDTFAK